MPGGIRGRSHETDVLIVGAGPVGLTLALGLARQGTRCRIVDRDAGSSRTSRASELHARTLEILDAMGVAADVLAEGNVLRTVTFVSRGRRVARLATAGIDSSCPARLGAVADTMYLVRPDGYLAFRGEPPDPASLEAYLGELFVKP